MLRTITPTIRSLAQKAGKSVKDWIKSPAGIRFLSGIARKHGPELLKKIKETLR